MFTTTKCYKCGNEVILHLSVYKNYHFYCSHQCANSNGSWNTQTYKDGRGHVSKPKELGEQDTAVE